MQYLRDLVFHPLPKGFSFSKISKLKKLERIGITQGCLRNLSGIEAFQNLEYLDIGYVRTLENIDGVSLLPKLKSIWLDSCPKLTNIDEIAKIKTLKRLWLENIKKCDLNFISNLDQLVCLDLENCSNLDSLDFINKLNNLETFTFLNTNVLDGNLTPCLRLKFVGTLDKRHYNLKSEQLPRDYNYSVLRKI